MAPRSWESVYLRVLARAWDGVNRVSYLDFLEALDDWRGRLRRERRADLPNPPHQTYSRTWRAFCRQHAIRRPTPHQIHQLILQGLAEGAWEASSRPEDALPVARAYFASQKTVPPAPTAFVRYLRSARVETRHRKQEETTQFLSRLVGTSLSDLPLAQRYRAVRNFPRFSPAGRGKLDYAKLAEENGYRLQIARILEENHLSIGRLLAVPDRERLGSFLERNATSTLARREATLVVQALPFYLVNRWQEALDTVLSVIVLLCRSTWSKIETRYAKELDESHRTFFEEHGKQFAPLQRAILALLEGKETGRLRRFLPLTRAGRRRTEELRSSEGFYILLARHLTHLRKLSLRLEGIPLVGWNENARRVVQALPELLRFALLSQPVPRRVRRLVSFLSVPDRQMASRRVFEGVLLNTLADMLHTGQITCPLSKRYANHWEKVESPEDPGAAEVRTLVERARSDLEKTWQRFLGGVDTSDWMEGRHLVSRRPSKKVTGAELQQRERAKRRLLRVMREIRLPDLLLEVHRSTGMLNAFQPPPGARHRLSKEEILSRVVLVIVGRATNQGLIRMASTRRKRGSHTIGELLNMDEGYVNADALRQALGTLAEEWERRRLGQGWGTGDRSAGDGRTMEATESDPFAAHNRRHKKTGITLYWLIRDDWLASRLVATGTRDFEAWHVVEAILRPDGGRSPRLVAGDTHGQQLAVWGLCHLLGIQLAARFHSLGRVPLYHNQRKRGLPIEGVEPIRWSVVQEAIPSLARMVRAIRSGQLTAEDVLRRGNVFDEQGRNVMNALRELGKAVRSAWVLNFAMSEELRRNVQLLCNRTENTNDFQRSLSMGNVGRMRVVDPARREVNALCIELVRNAIVFHNAEQFGPKLRKIPGASPLTWEHVLFSEPYRLTWRGSTDGKTRPL